MSSPPPSPPTLSTVVVATYKTLLSLLRIFVNLGQCNVVPVLESNPVILGRVSKSKLVLLPFFQEEVARVTIVSSPLQHCPASTVGLHVTVDGDVVPSHGDGGQT